MYRSFCLLIFIMLLSGCTKEWFTLIHDGDLAAVQQRLDNGADPNGTDAYGTTHLCGALKWGNDELVYALLEAGADPNLPSRKSLTPLHYAESPEMVTLLLEYGADPEQTNERGYQAADYVEFDLIKMRSEAAKSDDRYYAQHIPRLEATLQAYGRTPITEEQSWEKWPGLMAQYYPELAKSRAMETLTANGTIGIKWKQESDAPMVIALVPQGPAARSKQIQEGDFLIGVAPNGGDDIIDLDGLSLSDTIKMILGKKGQPVTLVLQREEARQPHQVTLTRGSITREQWQAFNQAQQQKTIQSLVIQDNSGEYLSPYTSDGVVAEWVNKAINNQMGSATGSAVGSVAGAYAANKALESVPGGSLIGGFLGSKAGKAVGTKMADDVSGGETYRRQTSDLSFHSLRDMAAWLREEHGDKANFAEVSKAANAVYPGLLDAISGQ